MKAKLSLIVMSAIALLLLPSCVDPGYYGGPSYYGGSSSHSALPYGYRTVLVGGNPYYYHGNSWYRRSSGRYISCSRPHGYSGSIGRHSSHRYTNHSTGRVSHASHGNSWTTHSGSNRYVTPRSSTFHKLANHSNRNYTSSSNARSRTQAQSYKPKNTYRKHTPSASTPRTKQKSKSHSKKSSHPLSKLIKHP